MQMMTRLPRQVRMRTAADFRAAFRRGRRVRATSLEVAWTRRDDLTSAQLGIVVGRTVGNAVVRNRIKRLIREWFRQCQGDLPPGHWVFRASRRAGEFPAQQLRDDLTSVVQSVTKRP